MFRCKYVPRDIIFLLKSHPFFTWNSNLTECPAFVFGKSGSLLGTTHLIVLFSLLFCMLQVNKWGEGLKKPPPTPPGDLKLWEWWSFVAEASRVVNVRLSLVSTPSGSDADSYRLFLGTLAEWDGHRSVILGLGASYMVLGQITYQLLSPQGNNNNNNNNNDHLQDPYEE